MGSIDAESWVDEFIARHMRTRVIDGRPSRQFRAAMVDGIEQLIDDVRSEIVDREPTTRQRKAKAN